VVRAAFETSGIQAGCELDASFLLARLRVLATDYLSFYFPRLRMEASPGERARDRRDCVDQCAWHPDGRAVSTVLSIFVLLVSRRVLIAETKCSTIVFAAGAAARSAVSGFRRGALGLWRTPATSKCPACGGSGKPARSYPIALAWSFRSPSPRIFCRRCFSLAHSATAEVHTGYFSDAARLIAGRGWVLR